MRGTSGELFLHCNETCVPKSLGVPWPCKWLFLDVSYCSAHLSAGRESGVSVRFPWQPAVDIGFQGKVMDPLAMCVWAPITSQLTSTRLVRPPTRAPCNTSAVRQQWQLSGRVAESEGSTPQEPKPVPRDPELVTLSHNVVTLGRMGTLRRY